MLLPAPSLGALRIASPNDILRIGIVATCGFRYSPLFPYERPYHEQYPADTLLSYRHEFAEVIKKREYIVLVAVDKYDPEEGNKSEAIIPPDNGAEKPLPGEEVIVGVGCWKLEAGSKRVGHFKNETGQYPNLPPRSRRDQNREHVKQWEKTAHDAEQKYFQKMQTMEMLVVHPAYWHRGHGSTLVGWGMALANIDRIKQGVIATQMGAQLYTELGYSELAVLRLDGDEEAPEGVNCIVMDYSPNRGKGGREEL